MARDGQVSCAKPDSLCSIPGTHMAPANGPLISARMPVAQAHFSPRHPLINKFMFYKCLEREGREG